MSNQPPLNPDALEAGAQSMECQCSKHVIDCGEYYADCPRHVHYPKAVSAYLAAALPEVTSVEELEALPEGTILRDSYGLALHKRTANWWVTNCDSNLTSEDLADEIADTAHTYTVLYRPEVKP